MKKIGLITFWDYNYGSSLQCYATKTILDSLGYRCELIEECKKGKIQKVKNSVRKIFVFSLKAIRYPNFVKTYIEMKKNAKAAKELLSPETRKRIHFFGRTVLQPKLISKKALEKLGEKDEYKAFITGSDQVWGGSFIDPTYGNFLEFAPEYKRIAYAASFGGDDIADYNLNKYTKGIKGINKISVREESGKRIIQELLNIEVEVMPDPTVLLSTLEWKAFAKNIKKIEEPYVLIHFLDRINETTVKIIKQFSIEHNMKILSVGWMHDEIQDIENFKFIDGDPREYISLIDGASYIFTDSFHTTLFSLRFKKQFFTIPRCYVHKTSQSTRITNLLKNCNCLSRYIDFDIDDINVLPSEAVDCTKYFDEEKIKGINFIKSAISEIDKSEEESKIPNLKKNDECCGCGVCAEKCPKNAIVMKYNDFGYCLPKVDERKCIKCNVCEKVCYTEINQDKYEKKAYISYSKNKDLFNKAASGGIFATIAKNFIEQGGVVYGATIQRKKNKFKVLHDSAESIEELYPLLNSKYVQSDITGVLRKIKIELQDNRKVLFCGTSCQVDALYRYLSCKPENLFTMDLICHGVPGEKLFSDYLQFVEKSKKSKIIDISFRKKINRESQYVEEIEFQNNIKTEKNSMQSPYYKMFFNCDSYREHCYNCEFASIQKPADITLGDYYEAKKDYPYLFEKNGKLENVGTISCMIIHNKNGEELLEQCSHELELINAEINTIQNSHDQLCSPSIEGTKRDIYLKLYKQSGFKGIYRYEAVQKIILFLPSKAKQIIKRICKCKR